MCLAQVSGTLLMYINIPIAIFDRAIFKNYFLLFLFQLQNYISAQAKPPFYHSRNRILFDDTVESGNFLQIVWGEYTLGLR